MKLDCDVTCSPTEEAAIWLEFLDVLRRHNATFSGWAEVYNAAKDVDEVHGNGEWPEKPLPAWAAAMLPPQMPEGNGGRWSIPRMEP